MIGFIFLALMLFGVWWAIGAMRAGGTRVTNTRLNNQGLQRPVTRRDHRQNDEE